RTNLHVWSDLLHCFGLLLTMKIATRTCAPSAYDEITKPGVRHCRAWRVDDAHDDSHDMSSRSREWNVLESQGCGFSLFSSCSPLLSAAKSDALYNNDDADFLFAARSLRAKARRQVVARSPVFLLLFTGKYRKGRAARGRARTLPMPHCIIISRVSAGARSRDLISHGVVVAFQKPHARGRARASRLRAAGGARPVQRRRPLVVEHARALHRRRRARRHGGGLRARRLPPSDQAGLRR